MVSSLSATDRARTHAHGSRVLVSLSRLWQVLHHWSAERCWSERCVLRSWRRFTGFFSHPPVCVVPPVGWFTRIACDRRCNCTTWCKLPPRADARRPSAFHSSMAIFSPEIGFLLSASFPPFFLSLSLFLFFFFSFSRTSFGSFGSKFDSDWVSGFLCVYWELESRDEERERERK